MDENFRFITNNYGIVCRKIFIVERNKQNFILISSIVFLDHKSLVVGIAVVIAFVFAVAGIFIGVYFRIERFLRCIDRIGGSNDTEAEALINDDTKV